MTGEESSTRIYVAVGAAATLVYLGALWNRFAMDDLTIVAANPLVHSLSGVWRAFQAPYFAPTVDASLYRPLPLGTYALDWLVGSTAWFHAVNLAWHGGASILVAVLARRWAGDAAALAAGTVFAVHPVHVEAVANVVGRGELMAAVFTLLAVYAALERRSVLWSALAMAAAVLSKENGAVAPGLVVWAWLLGVRPVPPRRKLMGFAASWIVLAAAYTGARWAVLHGFRGPDVGAVAPVFSGQDGVTIRLTALAALADVARLLLLPLALRADYSPDERTAVHTLADARLALGVLVLALWAGLLALAWRRGRKIEAFGLGWVAIAYSPVANLLFPVGILIAERTLYLPSAGLAIAVGAALRQVAARRVAAIVGVVFLAGALRTSLRVPVWRDDASVTLSIIEDSPGSYVGPKRMSAVYLDRHDPVRALDAARIAARIYPRDPATYALGAVAAFAVGDPRAADSMLARLEQICARCPSNHRRDAAIARQRGYVDAAESLLARARAFEAR